MRIHFDKLLAAMAFLVLLTLTCTTADGAALTMGSRGERVALIQQRLKEWVSSLISSARAGVVIPGCSRQHQLSSATPGTLMRLSLPRPR